MKSINVIFAAALVCSMLISCGTGEIKVKPGLEVLLDKHLGLLSGKKVGIITNQTGIAADGEHIVDVLAKFPDVTVTALFAPEHGIRGDLPDAIKVASYTDDRTGIRVWSLYGRALKPTEEMLNEVDILLYDIQDVGARFYTFISTMGLGMEAAAEFGKQFIVLDRPNPITGTIIEGPILEEQFFSFVGKYPIPIRYGMTPGELAQMIKSEGWMAGMDKLDLKVIPLEGWKREMWYDETGLPWIKPSPNIPSIITASLYPGLCLVEALNVSEARGTMRPFEQFGAPWIDNIKLAELMNNYGLPGIYFKPATFTPVSIPNAATRPKYPDEKIRGLDLVVTDRNRMRPLDVMIYTIITLKQFYPDDLVLRTNLERLSGIKSLRSDINKARNPGAILSDWDDGIAEFKKLREKYLIYR